MIVCVINDRSYDYYIYAVFLNYFVKLLHKEINCFYLPKRSRQQDKWLIEIYILIDHWT